MTASGAPRPSRTAAVLVWIAILLGLYGIAAVFGFGDLGEQAGDLPWSGFAGGFFTGLALLGIPTMAARTLGRTLVTPHFPGLARVAGLVGLIGMAAIGAIALLVDTGILVIQVGPGAG